MSDLTDSLRSDFARLAIGTPTAASISRALVTRPGFRAATGYRLARASNRSGLLLLGKTLSRVLSIGTGSEISIEAEIQGGLLLPHPRGVIVGSGCKIGHNVTIQQHATLGGNMGRTVDGQDKPTIGDNVAIGAGAVVAGPLLVGAGSVVGANTTVTRDVPPGSSVRAMSQVLESPPTNSERPA